MTTWSEPREQREPVHGSAEDREAEQLERTAWTVLVISAAAMLGLVALVLVGLLFVPADNSALGLMKSLVFQCH